VNASVRDRGVAGGRARCRRGQLPAVVTRSRCHCGRSEASSKSGGRRGRHVATLPAMTVVTELQRAKHLRVGREIASGLLGIGQLPIHRDFKHPATTARQAHRGVFHRLQDEIARRTGAWLIASHAAIFDFNPHGSVSQCDNRYAAAIRRRRARGISSASASTGGTSSGLASALRSDSRSAASFRSFSTFSPKTSLT